MHAEAIGEGFASSVSCRSLLQTLYLEMSSRKGSRALNFPL